MVLVTAGIIACLEVKPTLEDQIKETQKGHPSIKGIKKKVNLGKASEFTINSQGIPWYGKRLCVPNKEELKQQILAEAHTTPYSIHPEGTKMYKDLQKKNWWHGMKRDIAVYVARCNFCQCIKAEHQRPAGLLQPLRVPEWKWDVIGMDFIFGLPRS
jgi:hypothetical protein